VDDTDVELNPHTALIRHTVVSLDGRFDGYEVDDVLIKIVDNDAPLAGYRLEDFDSSGRVELKDLSLMAGDWLEGPVSWFDVTGDLEVDIEDLEQMAFNWLAPSEPEIEIQAICEYTQNPLGVDTPTPHLSWKIQTARRGFVQTAFQVLTASDPSLLNETDADVWNSGKVTSGKQTAQYAGATLASGQKYYWKVRVWEENDQPTGYSADAFWVMGLLNQSDWNATWITDGQALRDPAPLLRKEFSVSKPVKRATLHISGLGHFLAGINGQPVSDHTLETGWTTYAVRVPYRTLDVTDLLASGTNCIGVHLGNGWYNPYPIPLFGGSSYISDFMTTGRPRLIARLEIRYTDGTSSAVVTDTSWKTKEGPLLENDLYLGTKYDARLEMPGWDLAGFNDSGWSNVVAATQTLGLLRSDLAPPVRVTRVLNPVSVTEPVAGKFIFDFGQNFAGVCRLHIPSAAAGTQVQMRMGELLYSDGTLNDSTTKAYFVSWADQRDNYLCKAGGPQTYTPPFTFHGFRYVEVTGYPGTPTLSTLEGLRMNNDVENVGVFACSNPLLSKLWEMYDWTLKSNLFSVQSDCPGREKFGYGGDIVTSSEASMLGRDMANFYRKSIRDLKDAVRSNGGLPETAPYVGIASSGFGDGSGPIGWGTAHPVLIKNLRQYYGNEDLLAEQYATLKGWVDLLEANDSGYLITVGLSDHKAVYEKIYTMPTTLTSTGHYYYNARVCSEVAGLLGHTADQAKYATLAANIKNAFNNQFLDPVTGAYNTGTKHIQTCQAFALYYDLVPEATRDKALNVMINDIRTNVDYPDHLTTGIFGTKFMLDQLMKEDKAYIAYTMMNQRTYPGYGNWVDNMGATTILQIWDGTKSQNHPMFGSVVEWEMKCLAGILPADDAIGFDKIIIKPHLIGDLDWACGSYDSIRGLVESSWHVFEGVLYLDVTVPANTAATIYVPAADVADVTESGIPAVSALGLTYTGMADNRAVFAAGSGRYRFMSTSPIFSGDNSPPSPANCVWAVEPYAASADSIAMEVEPAIDESGVEYYFDCLTAGGHDSGWQNSTGYTDSGLQDGTEYTYRVKARDKISHLENGYSPSRSATTFAMESDPPTPNPATFSVLPTAQSSSRISMTATTGSDATGPIEYYFAETSGNPGGDDSGWQTDPTYEDTGLNPLTSYTYTVQMRDGWGNLGTASVPAIATTDDFTGPVISDSFNYTLGATLAGQNGGTGFSGPWSGGANIVAGLNSVVLGNMSGNAASANGTISPTRPFNQSFGNDTWFMFLLDLEPGTSGVTGGRIQFESNNATLGYGLHFDYSGTGYTMYVRVGASSVNPVQVSGGNPVLVVGHCVKGTTYSLSLWFNPSDLNNLGSPTTFGSGIAPPSGGLAQSVYIRGAKPVIVDEMRLSSEYEAILNP
jgi:alpha-L-rhamnosidase